MSIMKWSENTNKREEIVSKLTEVHKIKQSIHARTLHNLLSENMFFICILPLCSLFMLLSLSIWVSKSVTLTGWYSIFHLASSLTSYNKGNSHAKRHVFHKSIFKKWKINLMPSITNITWENQRRNDNRQVKGCVQINR